jgi:hypothetical protein
MGVTTAQVAAGGTATTLCRIPAGPCSVVISNGGTAIAYIGAVTSGTVTTGNGYALASGQVLTFNGYPGSAGAVLQVVTTVGAATLGVVISNSEGLPQPGIY